MNKSVLPPDYNDAIKSNGSNEGCSAWYPEHSTDFNHSTSQHGIFPREFDEIRRGQLQRSESKSSGSSGGSNIRFGNGNANMYNMGDQNYNLTKDLPPGWEVRFLSTGRIYYCHLPTDTQHWNHPHEKADLPPGWERVYHAEYGEYYVNHISKTAQFNHPGPLGSVVTGEEHAQALAAVKQRKILQDKVHSSTYVPPSEYLIEEIPDWLVEYANSHDQEYEWVEESYKDLDKYQTMMTRLYRQELKHVIEEYEDYRNRIIRELEERMQLNDLTQTPSSSADHTRETFV